MRMRAMGRKECEYMCEMLTREREIDGGKKFYSLIDSGQVFPGCAGVQAWRLGDLHTHGLLVQDSGRVKKGEGWE